MNDLRAAGVIEARSCMELTCSALEFHPEGENYCQRLICIPACRLEFPPGEENQSQQLAWIHDNSHLPIKFEMQKDVDFLL